MRPRVWERFARSQASAGLARLAGRAQLAALLAACATDEGASEPRGEAILRVQVSAEESGGPVAGATIRLFADYEQGCAQQGPLTAELVTDAEGALRLQAEGPRVAGGTCLSLSVAAPAETGLRSSQRVPFVLKFRTEPPLDSIQVNVALETGP